MSRLVAVLVGQPQEIPHGDGVWRSAIFKSPVEGPIAVGMRGLDGDQVADTKNHGSPDQALCCQPMVHYDHWNRVYGAILEAGAVGENWTIADWDEESVCVGDIWQVGSARVQVSAPRYPCYKQERKVGLEGFLKQVMESRRTGWYLRVLTPGTVQAGDSVVLESRPDEAVPLSEINRALLGPDFDPIAIDRHRALPELAAGWKRILEYRLEKERSPQ